MCGRYSLVRPEDELIEAFDLPGLTFDYFARYNVAPSQQAPVIAEDQKGRRIGLMEWGLIPRWVEEPGKPLINARSESVESKPSFRDSFARRRCIVPADGFYEWKRLDKNEAERANRRSTPHWIRPVSGGPIAFAGLWDRWSRPGSEARYTFTILTADANADVRGIHDRMPVVIEPTDYAVWLDRGSPASAVRPLLRPSPDGSFTAHPVSTRVNAPSEDDPGLIEPID